MTKKNIRTILKIVFPMLCVFMLIFIWGNSMQIKSVVLEKQSAATEMVRKIGQAITKKPVKHSTANFIVAKTGHVGEFFLFSLFLALSCRVHFGKMKEYLFQFLFISLLCGVIDEFIQFFSPGRESRAMDSLIDLFGAVIGICFAFLIDHLYKRFVIKKLK